MPTIKEILSTNTYASIYDKYEIAKYKGKVLRNYKNVHLAEDEEGNLTLYGNSIYTSRDNFIKLSEACYIHPDEEYKPNMGIWIGGYKYLYIKKKL